MKEVKSKTMYSWNIGNTSVRNPLRFEEGFRAIQKHVVGHLFEPRGWQLAVYEALRKEGVVDSEDPDEPELLGRKWVSGPEQLGFIRVSEDETNLTLTAAGLLLMEGKNPPEDIFLRQLLKYRYPNYIETRSIYQKLNVHPFWAFAKILHALQFSDPLQAGLSDEEIALFVVTAIRDDQVEESIALIKSFRQERDQRSAKKRAVADKYLAEVRRIRGVTIKEDSLFAYADSSRRHLLRTKLFVLRDKRMYIDEAKEHVALFVIENALRIASNITQETYENPVEPELPFAKKEFIVPALRTLQSAARKENIELSLPLSFETLSEEELRSVQSKAETQYLQQYEQEWAGKQKLQIDDIDSSFDRIADGTYPGSTTAAALYEWNTWRTFLAIGGYTNEISETRGFTIDTAMLPRSHAAGGQPDMRFEYQPFTLVLEVSLLKGENQWCREHEPVSRHVKEILKEGKKPAIGLFVGPDIHLNTYQHFLQGKQLYVFDEERRERLVDIAVAPLTHGQLCKVLRTPSLHAPGRLHQLLQKISDRHEIPDGKQWKARIEQIIDVETGT